MLDMNWKWKLKDKRTQDRYVEKGLLDKAKAETELKNLPDLAASATWVEIDMEDLHVDDSAESDTSDNTEGSL
ncbi:MAG: hypothetical protein EBQ92_08345 [Proteobacteria bacterium]|jgi:hypothetical protein|nr:hypothetical protein [Pseudomonadota bacterium]